MEKPRQEVKRKRDEYRQGISGHPLETKSYTVEEWGNQWLEHHNAKLKPTTQESYKYTSRLISAGPLGKKLLSSVKAYDMECFLQQLQDESSDSALLSAYLRISNAGIECTP